MIRFAFDLLLTAALLVVAGFQLRREWLWFDEYGSLDYLWIWLGGVAFMALIWGFDELAEAQGWIVHHWWD